MSKNLMKRLLHEDDASQAVEYGIITAVIAVGLIITIGAFKDEIVGMFNRAGDKVGDVGP